MFKFLIALLSQAYNIYKFHDTNIYNIIYIRMDSELVINNTPHISTNRQAIEKFNFKQAFNSII